MPAISIDTFFACSLIVSVAVVVTAFLAGTMQTAVTTMQDCDKQDYLRALSNAIVMSNGSPQDWGSTGTVPSDFGLSLSRAQSAYQLDADKISRLNDKTDPFLSYINGLKAVRINNIAFGISVTQTLQINVTLIQNTTSTDDTAYTFKVSVDDDSGPVAASLHGYAVSTGCITDVYNITSSTGVGYLTVQLPNSAAGPSVFAVFARAAFDDRVTAYQTYSFAHLSDEPSPNHIFLTLSPLNYILSVTKIYPTVATGNVYALTYAYQTNITSTLNNNSYAIPTFVDASPVAIIAQGTNETTLFTEWTAYPMVPLDYGADLSKSEANVFSYTVIINGAFYKLTLRFGDVIT